MKKFKKHYRRIFTLLFMVLSISPFKIIHAQNINTHNQAVASSEQETIASDRLDTDLIVNAQEPGIHDTLIFNSGAGNYIVNAFDDLQDENYGKRDKVIFGEGITKAMISFSQNNDDLIVKVGDKTDQITFTNYYKHTDYQTFNRFEFANGGFWADIRELTFPDDPMILFGTNGNDTLIGGSGNDVIMDYTGYNYLDGGAGDDVIVGRGEMIGGIGNDHIMNIVSNSAGEIIRFNLGDGKDIIDSYDSNGYKDRVIFGEDVTPDMITFRREGAALVVVVGDQGDEMWFVRFFGDESVYNAAGQTYHQFEFADGTVWEDIRKLPLKQYYPDDYNQIIGTPWTDVIYAGSGDDVIKSYTGYNYLDGGAGNDVIMGRGEFRGGKGNDRIVSRFDSSAGEIIHFNLGDGKDIIESYDSNASSDNYKDKVVFGEDVTPDMISFRREGTSLVVVVGDHGDEMNFVRFFGDESNSNATGQSYRQFEFADGTVWPDIRKIKLTQYYADNQNNILGTPWDDVIYAGAENDYIRDYVGYNYLDGGAGDDVILGRGEFRGGIGNDHINNRLTNSPGDIIHFNLGDGKDIIESFDSNAGSDAYKDKIIFGKDVTPDMVSFRRDGESLIVVVGDQGDEMHFINFFSLADGVGGQTYRHFEFTDGTIWPDIRKTKLTQYYADNQNNILGTPWDDAIYAGSGNDHIKDLVGYNYLDGGDGDDFIYGRGEFRGGKGNDYIMNRINNSAGDIIHFNLEDGKDTIDGFDQYANSDSYKDKIIFGKDVTPEMISFRREGNVLVVVVGNQGDEMHFINFFKGDGNSGMGGQSYRHFEFADGTVWEDIRKMVLKQYYPDNYNKEIVGTPWDDAIYAGAGDDTITDTAGYNYLDGGAGNDTITGRGEFRGGIGNDHIINRVNYSTGDIIHFNLGDGKDTIDSFDQYANSDSYKDKIIFGKDVTPEMISFRRDGDVLIVVVGDQGDEMHFINFFNAAGNSGMGGQSYRHFEFADGTVWEDIRKMVLKQYYPDNYNKEIVGTPWDDAIYAGAGDDTITDTAGYNYLDGGAGNDTITGRGEFRGGIGNDHIINRVNYSTGDIIHFNLGDGKDTIDSFDQYANSDSYKDKIIFGKDVTPEMISFRRDGDVLIVVVGDQGDEMHFINFFNGAGNLGMGGQSYRHFEFADGTVWTDIRPTLNNLVWTYYYGDEDDTIVGTSYHDAIYAGGGNDTITDTVGYNYLYGEAGDDTITGRGELIGGLGNDHIINRINSSAGDIIHFNLGDGKDTIDSFDQYANSDSYKDKIIFGKDVTPEMISFRRDGDVLIVVVGDQGDEMHFINFFKTEGNNGMAGQSYRHFEFADKTVWPDIRQLEQYKTGIISK
ncbi:hypothetical protein MTZ49_11095 [Entomomonas sp. E2T0]|uniref:calcium-binding protein n=1 Tax=Entomomonas sp. E2T0 TaxID=2930213 RepID=UPI0022281516|nr:calcium-binding protein [Entomomonas sp. E2T0]UYZ83144.1 hypothetical protein MTZ49_11095 [Entomomonas sp. E2T0]